MFNKIFHFIKYNNLTILLIFAFFMAGAGVFAQTPTGQDLIGIQEKKIEGVDNALLIAADLDNFKMDFKIEKIEEDAKYFYVTYTYLDLVKDNNAWQYQIQEKIKKVSKKLRADLGVYLADQFKQEYEAKIKDLQAEKAKAEEIGGEKRIEVVSYTGLVGQVLDVAGTVFPGYEPVKKTEVPSPTIPPTILQLQSDNIVGNSVADDLNQVYQEYITNNDISGITSNNNATTEPAEASTSTETTASPSEAPATTEPTALSDSSTPTDPTSVEVVELPTN